MSLATVASLRQHPPMSPVSCCQWDREKKIPRSAADQLVNLEYCVLSWVARERPSHQKPVSRDLGALSWSGHRTTWARVPSPPHHHHQWSSCRRPPATAVCRFSPSPCGPHPAARVRLNGSCRTHISSVRDDRARGGLRLDALPQTESKAPQTSCRTSAALKVCACVCVRVMNFIFGVGVTNFYQ